MLKENRTIQQLDISRKSIGVGGATALAEMLENRTLQQLNISSTSIGTGIHNYGNTVNELIITPRID